MNYAELLIEYGNICEQSYSKKQERDSIIALNTNYEAKENTEKQKKDL